MNNNHKKHTYHKEKVANAKSADLSKQAKYLCMEREKSNPSAEDFFRRPAYGKIGDR